MLTIDDALARRHYGEHEGKPFFDDLVEFITSGPVVAMQWAGEGAVGVVRTLVGVTNPSEAAPGTIRGDFGLEISHNIVHASDSADSAVRELGIFFG
jgi:nucleoside-diphosphate kinase